MKKYISKFEESVIEAELGDIAGSKSDQARAKKELINAFKNKALIYDFGQVMGNETIAISTGGEKAVVVQILGFDEA